MTEYRLHHLTWPQTEEALKTARVAIIPIGANEQHGPHLKMGTDWRIAERLAEETVAAADGLALMTPPLPIGFSPHHMDFPGTLTARPETLSALLDDVVDSLRAHGLERFVIMNGHGGNLAFLPAWTADLRARTGCAIAIVHWSLMGRDFVVENAVSQTIGHACEVETGLALDLAPELVITDQLGGPSPLIESEHPLVCGHAIPERAPGAFMPRNFSQLTENGALGDPSAADADAGARLRGAVVERSAELIAHLATTAIPGEQTPRLRHPGWARQEIR